MKLDVDGLNKINIIANDPTSTDSLYQEKNKILNNKDTSARIDKIDTTNSFIGNVIKLPKSEKDTITSDIRRLLS